MGQRARRLRGRDAKCYSTQHATCHVCQTTSSRGRDVHEISAVPSLMISVDHGAACPIAPVAPQSCTSERQELHTGGRRSVHGLHTLKGGDAHSQQG